MDTNTEKKGLSLKELVVMIAIMGAVFYGMLRLAAYFDRPAVGDNDPVLPSNGSINDSGQVRLNGENFNDVHIDSMRVFWRKVNGSKVSYISSYDSKSKLTVIDTVKHY